MDAQPKMDVNKLGLLTGYTPGSASVTFGKIKQKLKALGDSLSASPPGPITPKKAGGPGGSKKGSTSSTPSKSGTKRAAPTAKGDTPSKRAKKGGARTPVEDGSEDELPEDVYVKTEMADRDGDGGAGFYEELRGGVYRDGEQEGIMQ